MSRTRIFGLISVLAGFGCREDPSGNGEVGESDSSSESTGSTDTTDSTDSTTDSTDSTTGEDPSCEDDSYIGEGLASDDWGVGDLCDEIWVCADEDQVALILAAVPSAMCGPGEGCPGSHCTLSYQTIVDADVLAAVCTALLVPGIDAAYCIVYGP